MFTLNDKTDHTYQAHPIVGGNMAQICTQLWILVQSQIFTWITK